MKSIYTSLWLSGFSKTVSSVIKTQGFFPNYFGLSSNSGLVRFFCLAKFIALFCLLPVSNFTASAQTIKPSYLGVSEGVSSSVVNAVIQDSYGLLWIAGENGIQKYDGYRFQNFKHDPKNPNSLPHNICWYIFEDSKQNIWISTEVGISRYDRKSSRFTNYILNLDNPRDFNAGRSFEMFEDSRGTLFCGTTGRGLQQYDSQKDQWNEAYFQTGDNEHIKDVGMNFGCVEDANGDLWVGIQTDGIYRSTSGEKVFKPIDFEVPVDFSKSENAISTLFVDSRNRLWITTRNGVYRIDIKSKAFKTFATYDNRQLEVWNNWNAIREDGEGAVWIANNYRGMLRFENGGDAFETIEIDQVAKLPGQGYDLTLTTFNIDKSGIFWFGTRGKGVMKFDPVEKLFTAYSYQNNLSGGIHSNATFSMYESEKYPGKIYLGLRGASVDLFDPKTKSFTNIPYRAVDDMFGGSVRSIIETEDGSLLLGTWGDGIVELDKNFNELHRYTAQDGDISISHNQVRVLKKDDAGKIWIGTINGLNVWNRKENTFKKYESIPGRQMSKMLEQKAYETMSAIDSISLLNVGDNANLSRFIEVKNQSDYLITSMGEADSEISFDYGLLLNEKGDTIWTARSALNSFWAGGAIKNRVHLDVIALEKGKYTLKYVSDDSHSSKGFNETKPDLSEWWGVTMVMLNDNALKDEISALNSQKVSSRFLTNGNITDIVLDGDIAWLGTEGGGLNKLDILTGEVTVYKHNSLNDNSLVDNLIYDLSLGSEGFLWIGTDKGLNKFDIDKETFTLFNRESGLPTDQIMTIVEGDENEMWIATAGGLSRMVTNTSLGKISFINYFSSDGLASDNFVPLVGLRSSDSTYYFGSDFGMTTFRSISGSKIPPDVILSNLLISNKSVLQMGEYSPLDNSLESLQNITLSHDQNDLSFEFTALHYANPAKNQYAHKLEGLDKEWSYDNRNFASYTNLEPGEYTFKIRASNAYGVWNEEGQEIKITILSPWWQTWWAYSIYGILLVAIVLLADRILRKRLQAIEREKNREKELTQAKEIEKAYHKLEVAHDDLKSAQDRLVQQEKLASLGQLTAGIAHEIKNPLNFVNNFSEVSKELLEEMNEELEKGNLEDVKDISKDVIENLEKICHHGKRADSIVKGMLEHSRASTGTKEPTDINALTDEYLRLSYHGLRAKDKSFNANLKTDFDSSIGKIEVIPQDVGRVLLNLFNNAFYAVAERSRDVDNESRPQPLMGSETEYKPTISVSTSRVDTPLVDGGMGGNSKNHIEIRVSDNGNGIPDSIKDKIFQPFFTTKPTGQGTGLGLSLSYDIIKAHGGELKVETDGTGTAFTVLLPI